MSAHVDQTRFAELFESALELSEIQLVAFKPDRVRGFHTNLGRLDAEKFLAQIRNRAARSAPQLGELWPILFNLTDFEKHFAEYANTKWPAQAAFEIPEIFQNLTLNMDISSKGSEHRFFLTDSSERISPISGESYLLVNRLNVLDAVDKARKILPVYDPRGPAGVRQMKVNKTPMDYFNTYTPPEWVDEVRTKRITKCPKLFEKLVNHLFPIEEEREYFYTWLYDSLFSRAFVFLILCGAPGTGKNRLKLVMRALHGHVNTVDGKKSTFSERFNSQLSESTLAWFDELKYDQDMENAMKEVQNDSISIEQKGVDATRSTKIYASIVISNNRPRDNFIDFEARKFVPLVLNNKRLETSMTSAEIDFLTRSVTDPDSPDFDSDFLCNIVAYLKHRGRSEKWKNLEYRGPMFWTLAHTSMTRWQKRTIMLLTQVDKLAQGSGWDEAQKAFKWSFLFDKEMRRHSDKTFQFPDFSSIQAFLEVFRDSEGQKAFETISIAGSILGDFWVRPLLTETKVMTESSVLKERHSLQGEKQDGTAKEEHDDSGTDWL